MAYREFVSLVHRSTKRDYLARVNARAAPALGRRVVVIGGGNAAIDVARSARRAGI